MNNRILLYVILGVIIIVCAIFLGGVVTSSSAIINDNSGGANINMREDILVVTGVGKVRAKPDVAYLNVGVRTVDKDARKAQEDNKDIMERIVNRLKSLNIDEKDIQTSAYNIWPRYNYRGNTEVLEGYEVENMIRIAVRDVDSVGNVLDAVSKEGANRSNSISFGVLDSDAIYKQTLEKAIEDAKGKAEVIAKKADVTVVKPLAIYEGNAPGQVFRDDIYNMVVMEDADASRASTVPISPGELEYEANVTIVYKTK
ncbi:MAG: SIMPL domain-containing protein [Caldicoprobacterales bacterium]